MAAVHEAGHAVIAAHLGVHVVRAYIAPSIAEDLSFEKAYVGQIEFRRPRDLKRRRLIAVAGSVGEQVWRARGPAQECWGSCLFDESFMSASDWLGTGCEPGEPDDALIAAAEAADALLGGELLPELRQTARSLIRDAEVRS